MPAGGEDAGKLGDRRGEICDVGEGQTAHDERELPVLGRDPAQISLVEHRLGDGESGPVEHLGSEVDAHHVMAE